jgi:hypothetical protein
MQRCCKLGTCRRISKDPQRITYPPQSGVTYPPLETRMPIGFAGFFIPDRLHEFNEPIGNFTEWGGKFFLTYPPI